MKLGKAFQFKYIFEDDKDSLIYSFPMLMTPQQTMESIVNYIATGQGKFQRNYRIGKNLSTEIKEHTQER
jgi:uncharacterized protein